MLKFFRALRQRMLSESKFSPPEGRSRAGKYLLYALGEIILVVIGILFALQINNWNTERVQEATMHNYYEHMSFEIESEIKSVEHFHTQVEELRSMNKRTLTILDSKDQDSIPALKETLGALGTSWVLVVKFPVIEEFMEQGYLSKIENDSLKLAFSDFAYSMERLAEMSAYTQAQYNDRIEPFINKHLNYSEVALQGYKEGLVLGGPPTDFDLLFSNLELWNIATFKLEGLNLDVEDSKRVIAGLKNLNVQIEKELDR